MNASEPKGSLAPGTRVERTLLLQNGKQQQLRTPVSSGLNYTTSVLDGLVTRRGLESPSMMGEV